MCKYSLRRHCAGHVGNGRKLLFAACEYDLSEASALDIQSHTNEPRVREIIDDQASDLVGFLQSGELDLGGEFGGGSSRYQPQLFAPLVKSPGDIERDLVSLTIKSVEPPRVKSRVVKKPEKRLTAAGVDLDLVSAERERPAGFANQQPFAMGVDQVSKLVAVYHS